MANRLIAVDMDGTMLRSDSTVSDRTREALARAIAGGATLAVATGRRKRTAEPILTPLGLHYYLVASQGAVTWDGDHIVEHAHLPAASARRALEILRRHNLPSIVFGNSFQPEAVWVDGDWQGNARIRQYVERNKGTRGAPPIAQLTDEALAHDPVQFIVFDTVEKLEALDEDLTGHAAPPPSPDAPAQPGPNDVQPLWRVIFSKDQFTAGAAIEIVGPDTSKWHALEKLAAQVGIAPADVVAFGDNVNDLEMLAYAGFAVCMGNGTEDARAITQARGAQGLVLTETNNEDGVAAGLQRLGLV